MADAMLAPEKTFLLRGIENSVIGEDTGVRIVGISDPRKGVNGQDVHGVNASCGHLEPLGYPR
jgi:hypothetical protein